VTGPAAGELAEIWGRVSGMRMRCGIETIGTQSTGQLAGEPFLLGLAAANARVLYPCEAR